MKYRLEQMFPGISFKVIGEPTSVADAQRLAEENRFQFEWWALSLVRARPIGGEQGSKQGKKGADKGIDGVIPLVDTPDKKLKRILVSVKSGKVSVNVVRELVGVLEANKDPMGILLTLELPTEPMIAEAVSAGSYESPLWQKKFPRVQILTIEDIFRGKKPNIPQTIPQPKAAPISTDGTQPNLM